MDYLFAIYNGFVSKEKSDVKFLSENHIIPEFVKYSTLRKYTSVKRRGAKQCSNFYIASEKTTDSSWKVHYLIKKYFALA